mmetsp:Transcript_14114/g.59711  ORF Transcript_14114/g.59711 Transcript_14114/m.59711 type:complete len:290 (-) Transcript_14114:25-894(-)
MTSPPRISRSEEVCDCREGVSRKVAHGADGARRPIRDRASRAHDRTARVTGEVSDGARRAGSPAGNRVGAVDDSPAHGSRGVTGEVADGARVLIGEDTADAERRAPRDGGGGPASAGPSPSGRRRRVAAHADGPLVLLRRGVSSLGLNDDRLSVPGLAVVLRGLRRRQHRPAAALELLHEILEVRHELLEGDEPVSLVSVRLGELLLHDLVDLRGRDAVEEAQARENLEQLLRVEHAVAICVASDERSLRLVVVAIVRAGGGQLAVHRPGWGTVYGGRGGEADTHGGCA